MRNASFRFGIPSAVASSAPTGSLHAVNADPNPNSREISVLEGKYPGVVRTLTLLWGHPELTEFLARVSAGLEPRLAHIEPTALAELMLLAELHRSICPPTQAKVQVFDPIGRQGAWRPAIYRG